MRGALLQPALLALALGLALALAPKSAWTRSLSAWVAVSGALAFAPWPRACDEAIFFGGWISVVASAAVVLLLRDIRPAAALALSVNAAFWAGSAIELAGSPLDLFVSLPCVLVVLPAAWVAKRWRSPIVLRTVASWLIVVALLIVSLQFLPVTPGYLPDHLE